MIEHDVTYRAFIDGAEEDTFQFADEASDWLTSHDVGGYSEDVLVGWEADTEHDFTAADGRTLTLHKAFDEDAENEA